MTKCILVVDDEESLRELACICLEDLGGWEVIMAESGSEGLLKAETHPPDAILLDVSMPEMDGFQCYEKLKANPVTQTIPVILLTAKVLPDDRTRFAQMAIAGVITKPFDPTLICDQVAELLGWNGSEPAKP
ncbi:MAG: response regulator [Cyanobacteria bacterium CRU_2_1]|nr:response regulator [Cyanobacteria bacterium RU_5_0]NJR61854.1 response regulator [Cyanobacteria bacterium CRU_2_1]